MNFNIDKVIGRAMHRPQNKETREPLYLRKGETGRVYSSPTNIRGVVLSGLVTVTRTWVEPVGTTTKTFIGNPTVKGKEEKHNLRELCMMKHNYMNERNKYMMAKSQGIDAEEPEKINVTGEGLKCLTVPLVCNNIEVIAFTGDIAMANDLVYNALVMDPSSNEVSKEVLLKAFCKMSGLSNIGDIQKRFPLLKRIIYIDTLEFMLQGKDKKQAELILSNKFSRERLLQLQNSGVIGRFGIVEFKPVKDRLDVRDGIYELDEKLRGIRVASLTETETPAKEVKETDDNKLVRVIESTISNGIQTSENTSEEKARLKYYVYGLEKDYGKDKASKIIHSFKDDELKEKILNL